VSKVCQYVKLSHYAPKQCYYAQLCSHLSGYHYAQNYAGIIRQGLVTGQFLVKNALCLVICQIVQTICPDNIKCMKQWWHETTMAWNNDGPDNIKWLASS